MPRDVRRRTFLATASRAALAASLFAPVRCAGPAASRQAPHSGVDALVAELERDIPAWMAAARQPGLGMALIRNAAVVWQRSFGVADAETNAPVTDTTVFEAASMSKPVFAYGVLKLHEFGLLDLDTPLTTYTMERLVDDPRLDRISARHVLSHTSGLPNWRSGDRPLALAFAPGQRWLYSGEAYYYLQSVVTALTGRRSADICSTYEAGLKVCATDIDTHLKANVLLPLGMSSAGYVWSDELAEHVARPHNASGAPIPKTHPTAPDVARYAAAGGLHCTVGDYARFVIAVIDPGPPDRHRLAADTIDEMVRPIVRVSETPVRSSWALGWQVLHSDAGNVIAHGGDNTGFHAFAAASRDRRSGFVVMTNGEGGSQVIARLLDTAILPRLTAS